MKTSNNDISNALIEKADKWADNKSISEWAELSKKHFGTKGIRDAKLDKKSTIHIYLAEHPTEAPKEQEQDLLCGITKGDWNISEASGDNTFFVYTDGETGREFRTITKIHYTLSKSMYGVKQSFHEAEANAKLISNAPRLAKENAQLLKDNEILREALQNMVSVFYENNEGEAKTRNAAKQALKQTEQK